LGKAVDQWNLSRRIELVYENTYVANILTICVSFLLILVLYNHIPAHLLLSWFVLIVVFSTARILLAWFYRRRKETASTETWVRRYILASLASGIAWGCSSYFYFLVTDPALKALIVILLIGIIASAMIVLSAILRIFFSFILPVFTGLILAVLLNDDPNATYLFGGLLLYLILITQAGRRTSQYLYDCMQLQYENEGLVFNLKKENTQRKKVQQQLEKHQHELEAIVERRTSQLQYMNNVLIEENRIRKKAEEKLKHLAYHDDLTRLPNRLLLMDRLTQAVARANRHSLELALLFVDLDGFKQINDNYGHHAGDAILKGVAIRLCSSLREEDTVARYGGDEFVVLVELEGGWDAAEMLAKKLIDVLAKPFIIDGQVLAVACSIGISVFPHHGNEVKELLKKADSAMYNVKSKEQSSFRFYSEEDDSEKPELE